MAAPSSDERPKEVHWHINPVARVIYDRAEAVAGQLLADRDEIRVLDVGCGMQSSVQIPGTTHLVGVDVDEEGLAENESLDERILAGVEDMGFPDESFDGIVSVYALEHVAEPDVAIGRMARMLKPGGVLIAVFPNVRSPKALLTRATPTSFHVWAYRHVLGKPVKKAASRGGTFPTVLDASLRRERVERLMRALGLEVAHFEQFEDNKQRFARERVGLVGARWETVRRAVRTAFGPDVDPGITEFIFVARRSSTALPPDQPPPMGSASGAS